VTGTVSGAVFKTDQGATLRVSASGSRVAVTLQVNAFMSFTHTLPQQDARRLGNMLGFAANDAEAAALAATQLPPK